MNEIKELMQQIGLPPVVVIIIVIVAPVGVVLGKLFLKRQAEREKKEYEKLYEYRGLQEEALLKAHRMLYEEVDLKALTSTQFRQRVSEADRLIMEPFTKYCAYLPQRVKDSLYNIHNIVAQYKGDPTVPYRIKLESINNLCCYRDCFLNDIKAFTELIKE